MAAKKKAAPVEAPVEEAPVEVAVDSRFEDMKSLAESLYADAVANPGNGVLVFHLGNILSGIDSYETAARVNRHLARPEGE